MLCIYCWMARLWCSVLILTHTKYEGLEWTSIWWDNLMKLWLWLSYCSVHMVNTEVSMFQCLEDKSFDVKTPFSNTSLHKSLTFFFKFWEWRLCFLILWEKILSFWRNPRWAETCAFDILKLICGGSLDLLQCTGSLCVPVCSRELQYCVGALQVAQTLWSSHFRHPHTLSEFKRVGFPCR